MSIVTSLSQWRLFRKSTEGTQGEITGTKTSHLKCFQVLKNQYSSDKTVRSHAKAHLIYNLHVQLLFRLKGIIIWRRFVHRARWRVELRFPNFLLDFDKVDCRGNDGSSWRPGSSNWHCSDRVTEPDATKCVHQHHSRKWSSFPAESFKKSWW